MITKVDILRLISENNSIYALKLYNDCIVPILRKVYDSSDFNELESYYNEIMELYNQENKSVY